MTTAVLIRDVIVRFPENKVGYFERANIVKYVTKSELQVRLHNVKRNYKHKKINIDLKNDFMFPIGGYSAQPYIVHGDYVMCLVTDDTGNEVFVPGIVNQVQCSPWDKYYLILYFNGKLGINKGSELAKIGKYEYGAILNFIMEKMNFKKIVPLEPAPVPKPLPPPESPVREPLSLDPLPSQMVRLTVDYVDTKYVGLHEKLSKKLNIYQRNDPYFEDSIELLRKIKSEFEDQEFIQSDVDFFLSHKIKEQLIILRKTLKKLNVGEVVLAKWPDDGWYYFSKIKSFDGQYTYTVMDDLDDEIEVTREDIVELDNRYAFEPKNAVIAPHPSYVSSYAPALIIENYEDIHARVKFYDGVEANINKKYLFLIGLCKLEVDAEQIEKLENRWLKKTVVARNNFSGQYELGVVQKKISNRRQYVIKSALNDTEFIANDIIHMFGKYTRMVKVSDNNCVLAKKSDESKVFLIGSVIKRSSKTNTYTIKFIDGEIVKGLVQNKDFFRITIEYCSHVIKFIKDFQKQYL